MEQSKPKVRRCAVYTRKSSEEGLEQNFNSLHAQRKACEAFIKSQASEGWKLIKTTYDDGGLSGGTMERRSSACSPTSVKASLMWSWPTRFCKRKAVSHRRVVHFAQHFGRRDF
jgi:hypothetical protein